MRAGRCGDWPSHTEGAILGDSRIQSLEWGYRILKSNGNGPLHEIHGQTLGINFVASRRRWFNVLDATARTFSRFRCDVCRSFLSSGVFVLECPLRRTYIPELQWVSFKTPNGVFTAKTANFARMPRHHQAIEKYKKNNAHRYPCFNEHIFVAEFENEKCGRGCSAKKKKVKFPTPL